MQACRSQKPMRMCRIVGTCMSQPSAQFSDGSALPQAAWRAIFRGPGPAAASVYCTISILPIMSLVETACATWDVYSQRNVAVHKGSRSLGVAALARIFRENGHRGVGNLAGIVKVRAIIVLEGCTMFPPRGVGGKPENAQTTHISNNKTHRKWVPLLP